MNEQDLGGIGKLSRERLAEVIRRFKGCFMKWKQISDIPEDDKTYLVCWLDCEGKYSSPHRAYYIACEGKFFSLENNNSHPIVCDIYMEIPELP